MAHYLVLISNVHYGYSITPRVHNLDTNQFFLNKKLTYENCSKINPKPLLYLIQIKKKSTSLLFQKDYSVIQTH